MACNHDATWRLFGGLEAFLRRLDAVLDEDAKARLATNVGILKGQAAEAEADMRTEAES